ncbi:tail fiber protein [Tenacibaculum sp. M341]|uniref:tail fiber protein n=1 Tax=Tenacibaculum sp. M341 TaxID=2530339 RepID=UPI00104AE4B2|nr:tail fiber protein [Tenacibaculum sp. M341]TCI90003.1 hypothetical protein EYW44_15160 [Tenacibaculum sp. M341]
MKNTIKIAVIALVGMNLGVNAQLDSNNNLQIGYKKKLYSVSAEPYKFEMIPFSSEGNTEFRNYYATGKYQFYVSDGTHGNGKKLSFLINHDGNIGIGTTNPSSKLTVGTQTSNSPSLIAQFGSHNPDGEARVLSLINSGGGTNPSTSIDFHNNSIWSPTGKIQTEQVGTSTESVLNFYTYNSGLKKRMIINQNGHVGIGTISPNSKLTVGTQTSNSPSDIAQFGSYKPDGEARVLSLVNSGGGSNPSTSIDFHNNSNWSPTGKIQTEQIGTSTESVLNFYTYKSGLKKRMIINQNGHVGIGTFSPDMELTVNGKIHAKEMKIDLAVPAPDYVFKSDYNLRSIEEIEHFINKHSHLPEIPSAEEFAKNGVMQAEMDMNLLKKIEELTLYTIDQQKEINSQKKEIEELKKQKSEIKQQQKKIEKLESLIQKILRNKN